MTRRHGPGPLAGQLEYVIQLQPTIARGTKPQQAARGEGDHAARPDHDLAGDPDAARDRDPAHGHRADAETAGMPFDEGAR